MKKINEENDETMKVSWISHIRELGIESCRCSVDKRGVNVHIIAGGSMDRFEIGKNILPG